MPQNSNPKNNKNYSIENKQAEQIDNFSSIIRNELEKLDIVTKRMVESVWENKSQFVKWPKKAILLWNGCVRLKYHKYPIDLKKEIKVKGINIDSRSNGPAIISYLFAGGIRPIRESNPTQQWHIHHIYDGRFPWPKGKRMLHAVKDGKHFTQSAGLVAIHPIADAIAEEYPLFSWLLKRESFAKFNYDPELIFCKKINTKFSISVLKYNYGGCKTDYKNILHSCPKARRVWCWILETIKPKSVIDPFLGSGTTAEVCTKLGIPWIGYEIKEVYSQDINKRLKNCKKEPRQITLEV